MLELDKEFRDAVGIAVFNHLLKTRQRKLLRFDGKPVLTGRPAFLETAVLLNDCFCACEAWSDDPSIRALVQVAVGDLEKEESAHRKGDDVDPEYLRDLIALRSNLQAWLRS